ncbi:class I SAM-dependent methyltransferase [Enterovirga rhinocerotis]|uniref:Putative nicotinamide N-methyase n=1 Tax=Enterovirga rhinocerotis TaxID=1339210 RepID=A0A4V3DXY9_9HYPH|nr:putative nicotinamide N-methyase [Enterovirga rhinocerotis]
MTIADRRAFILAQTRLLPVPHVPEVRLHLADEATALWERTEEELGEIGLPPPFWAFAWAGGQGLARYVLDHRDAIAGRRVLDVASGSGLVAIAAMLAGARAVEAADIDAFATEAILLNAEANGVAVRPRLEDLIGRDEGWDTVLAGDIFYDRDIAAAMEDWLRGLQERGATVLIGDPGRSYLPTERLEEVAAYSVPVTRALEDAEIKRAKVWRLR